MNIVSWNVNGLNHSLENVCKLAKQLKVDVICLQETKTFDLIHSIDEYKVVAYSKPIKTVNSLNYGVVIYTITLFLRYALKSLLYIIMTLVNWFLLGLMKSFGEELQFVVHPEMISFLQLRYEKLVRHII